PVALYVYALHAHVHPFPTRRSSDLDTLPEAMASRAGLAPGESIITRDGVWLSRDWLLMPDSDTAQVGVIERQKKVAELQAKLAEDRKSTRLNSSHVKISYAVFCLKK